MATLGPYLCTSLMRDAPTCVQSMFYDGLGISYIYILCGFAILFITDISRSFTDFSNILLADDWY